jgi:hypothetical protein
MIFESGKQTIKFENLETVKNSKNLDFNELERKILPLNGKIRTNRLVLSVTGEAHGKEVPVRVFLLGGTNSKITQFSTFYEDEITYNHIKGKVILAQIIFFEQKHVSIENSPILNIKYDGYSKIEKLENSNKVWRYLNFHKLEDLIKTKALYFNRLDRFDDVLEGISPSSCEDSIIHSETNKTAEEKAENVKLMKERFEFARKSTFTSCWHINEKQNDRMWAEYANERSSVAIETTYRDLLGAKEDIQLPVHIERIRYFDEPYVNQESYWFPFLFKRKVPFEWENELRLSIYGYNYEDLTHLRTKVPLEKIIRKIHLSPLAKKYELIQLEKLLKLYKVNFPIYYNNKRIN